MAHKQTKAAPSAILNRAPFAVPKATTAKMPSPPVPDAELRKLTVGLAEIRKQWENGHARTARKICTKLLRSHPENGELLHLNGLMHHHDGKTVEAVRSLEKACNSAAPQPVFFIDLAAVLENSGYEDQARSVLQEAAKRFPFESKIRLQLGLLESRGIGIRNAIPHLKHAIALSPKDWKTWNCMGAVLLGVDDIEAAAKHFTTALELAAKQGDNKAVDDIRISIGECHKELGEVDKARELFESILKKNPTNVRAWHCLTLVTKVSRDHPAFAVIHDIYQSGKYRKLAQKEQEMLLFSLGKVEMEHNNPDGAMRALDEANALKRKSINYSGENATNLMVHTCQMFPASRFENLGPIRNDSDEPQHVFIVGMPRSGTTLIEQILSSHSAVFGAGELDTMAYHHNALVEYKVKNGADRNDVMRFDDDFVRIIGQAYRKEVLGRITHIKAADPSSETTRRIIDKLPGNYTRAGILALMLPNTRIIHCRRHPLATCFSIYTRSFSGVQNFAYDQRELGHQYKTYLAYMDHWRDVIPADRLIEVDYEDVVDNLETEARRLVEFIGLPWEDACLNFHKNDRQVRTHSALQVRKPIYRSSLNSWGPYIDHFKPLIETIGLDYDELKQMAG